MTVKVSGKSCNRLKALRDSRVKRIAKIQDTFGFDAETRIIESNRNRTIKRLRKDIAKIDTAAGRRKNSCSPPFLF